MTKFQPVKGMQDFLPERARKKQFIEQTCKEVFELFGFEPLQTPVLESLELLTAKGGAGAEMEKDLYAFKDQGERSIGMRFDFTVPLARVIASNPQLPKPFKRYQLGTVYRYDQPQAGRYREFSQADIDIVGSSAVWSEVECVQCVLEVFKRLGIQCSVRVNNRKLLEALALACGVKKNQVEACLRALDKQDKIGWAGVEKELKENKIALRIINVVQDNDLSKARVLLEKEKQALEGLNELNAFLNACKMAGIAKNVKADLSLARGLAYYTGIVFEVKAAGKWTAAAGGRYDNLVQLYGGPPTPAVGISIGVERVLLELEEKLPLLPSARVIVISLGEPARKKALEMAQLLRRKGVAVELDVMERGIGKNLEYASKKNIPFAFIIGDNELKARKAKVRNLKTGEEKDVPFKDLENMREFF